MKTAAAFAKGLLELEGDLPPILVSLVHKEKGYVSRKMIVNYGEMSCSLAIYSLL